MCRVRRAGDAGRAGMMVKAIETQYKGYRFRSRLEARWAVFFDAMGIEFQYEPEGFDLGDGILYLPDFWLPKDGLWIEIKPIAPNRAEIEKTDKLWRYFNNYMCECAYCVWSRKFELEITDPYTSEADELWNARPADACMEPKHGGTVIIISGEPWADDQRKSYTIYNHDGRITNDWLFACPMCETTIVTSWNQWDDGGMFYCNDCDVVHNFCDSDFQSKGLEFHKGDIYTSINPALKSDIRRAYHAARSARFGVGGRG